ncbi:unnamed protein product [Symbiodinium microadriaticum]|nr:unnamed protein product [Symbiodinium microadriaticum]CAE7574880.1 unnamed protein product [Symbiodinium sp. KB8]
MANLLESTMELVGGKEWSFEALAVPQMGHVASTEIDNPITMDNFLSSACRRCEVRTATLMFDFHPKVPEFGGLARLGELIQQGEISDLPAPLSLNGNLPARAKMGIIVHNLEDGTMHVLKILHFTEKFAVTSGLELCTGNAYIPVFRQGPCSLRKAIQHLLERIPGYRLLWNHVVQKQQPIQRSSSSQWTPDVETLKAGIDYINPHAPEEDAQSEQTFWILCEIREESGSPIAGWPETKVRNMCQNKSKGLSGAKPQTEFPLTLFSLKGFVSDFLVKFILPLLLTHGLLLLGMPGVGKTRIRDHDGTRLRQRVPRVQEAIFLDDPQIDRVSASDLKSFITADEEQTCSGRYSDVRLTRNGMRVYASNDFEPDDEPEADGRATITMTEFKKMMTKIFKDDGEGDILAVLKRSIVFVFGKRALYLRLPSENAETAIHRITVEDVHLDLLSEKDKPYYNKYKQGKIERSPDYDSEVARELKLMDNAVADLNGFAKVDAFMKHWNEKIQTELFHRQTPRRVIEASESSQETPDLQPAPPVGVRLADPRAPRKRLTNASRFIYPSPTKRYREKTCPAEIEEAAPANSEGAEQQQQHEDPESVDDGMDVTEEDVGAEEDAVAEEADEEAANFLHQS